MRKSGVSFDELRDLLQELGFHESVDDKKRIRFEHEARGTVLLFRKHNPKELVTDRDMLVVRRQLVDNGLIGASAFDDFLQSVSA